MGNVYRKARRAAAKGRISPRSSLCKVLFVGYGQEPELRTIDRNDNATIRALVPHFWTYEQVLPGIVVVAAEDYHRVEHQPNGCGLYGPYFFAGLRGDFVSLSDEQIEACRAYVEKHRKVRPPSAEEMKIKVVAW